MLMSCETPTWKQRGFQSEQAFNQHINDSIAQQKWLDSDSKFMGIWIKLNNEYSYMGVESKIELEVFDKGFGNITKTVYSNGRATYMRDSKFKWSKVDNQTIRISNLLGPYEVGEYIFQRYNGTYNITKEYSERIINKKTGDWFSKE